MNEQEYQKIQKELSHLLDDDAMKYKWLNAKEQKGYKKAILACKSVLSQYNPNKHCSKECGESNIVQEIRHGKPVQIINDVVSEKAITVCSCCYGKISKNDTWCKHCGAKMDSE